MEDWQFKKYYATRIVIPTANVLDPRIDGLFLLCLSPAEIAILREIVAYCHRRSTWAMTFVTGGYYAPDNVTWDAISAIVAELESKLMTDCNDLLARLDDMIDQMEAQSGSQATMATALGNIGSELVSQGLTLDGMATSLATSAGYLGTISVDTGTAAAALACLCSQLTVIATKTYDPVDITVLPGMIEGYITDETLRYDDPYGDTEGPELDTDACAISQLVFAFAYETLTEVLMPTAQKIVSVLLPAVLLTLAGWLGATVVGIPVASILTGLGLFIQVWAEGTVEGVVNTYLSTKEELICEAYKVLRDGGTYGEASAAMGVVIDAQEDLSPIDKLLMRACTSAWQFEIMAQAWDNMSSWALARVSAGYCSACEAENVYLYNYPPCPNGWTLYGTAVCWQDQICVLHGGIVWIDVFLPALASGYWNRLDLEADWKSYFGSGWTVAGIYVDRFSGDTPIGFAGPWSPTTSVAAGELNEQTWSNINLGNTLVGGEKVRLRINGAGGQYQEQPYPYMGHRIRFEFRSV